MTLPTYLALLLAAFIGLVISVAWVLRQMATPDGYWHGTIDRWELYDHALTPDEVERLHGDDVDWLADFQA